MSDPQPQADPPRSDSRSDEQRSGGSSSASVLPAWNRERLIEQFQQIDNSTRSEAERQIAAFERSFGGRIANLSGAGPPQTRPKK